MASLSEQHPDGWGIATFGAEGTALHKQTLRAGEDPRFLEVARDASASTLLCHIRKATHGGLAQENCHPFRHGRWVFAHNGTCYGFAGFRDRLVNALRPALRDRIAGETDSEVFFHLLLNALPEAAVEADEPLPLDLLAAAAREATGRIWAEVPHRHPATCESEDPSCLSFLLTDGEVLLAHQGGRPLHFSLERGDDASSDLRCGTPLRRIRVASEPLSCSADWTPLETFEMVGAEPGAADGSLRLRRFAPARPAVAF